MGGIWFDAKIYLILTEEEVLKRWLTTVVVNNGKVHFLRVDKLAELLIDTVAHIGLISPKVQNTEKNLFLSPLAQVSHGTKRERCQESK